MMLSLLRSMSFQRLVLIHSILSDLTGLSGN